MPTPPPQSVGLIILHIFPVARSCQQANKESLSGKVRRGVSKDRNPSNLVKAQRPRLQDRAWTRQHNWASQSKGGIGPLTIEIRSPTNAGMFEEKRRFETFPENLKIWKT